jgi:hypothetical protein
MRRLDGGESPGVGAGEEDRLSGLLGALSQARDAAASKPARSVATVYVAGACDVVATEHELVAQDAAREGRADDAARLREGVLRHVAAIAERAGAEDGAAHRAAAAPAQPDVALVESMGLAWIVRRLLGLDTRQLDVELAWSAIGETFRVRYVAGYRVARASAPPDETQS